MADDDLANLTPVLRDIVERQEITILFQPIFNLSTRQPHGFEALACGPAQSPLEKPANLFRAASAANLLLELDCACRQRAIQAARHLPAKYHLFVKTSSVSVKGEGLPCEAPTSYLEGELMPSQFVWQISERHAIQNYWILEPALKNLTELGCRVALDNVGRGYSGLAEIGIIKPQYIKMAREMTHEIHTSYVKKNSLSIFSTLAKKIDANLVATGIEQMEELEELRRIGINLVQGYLLARPSQSFQMMASVRL